MRLDLYVFREWLKVFLLSLVAIVGILLLESIQNELQDLLRYGAGLPDILTYYLVLLPSFLPLVIPISLMVSLLFSLGKLHRYREITAMQACGLSIWRISRTLWLAGIVLAYGLFELNGRITPWSVEQSRLIADNLRFASELTDRDQDDVGLLYNLSFYNHSEDRLWFINRFNEFNYRAFGITISELNEDRVEFRRLVANEGYFEAELGSWRFVNGRIFDFDSETGDPIRSVRFDSESVPAYTENPDLMKFMEKRPKDLSFYELHTILATLDAEADPRVGAYAVAYYGMLLNPLSCLIVVGLAIPFAVAGVRSNPMVGVSKAMGLFFAYYLLVQVSQILGQGRIDPLYAAALPNLIALVLGIYFQYRSTKPQ